MKILVVEDDELIAQVLSVILSKYRYAVEVVGDGLSALEMLEAFDFDVVLLDILLPKLSGLEVCKQARAKGIQVPILMLTARDSSQDKAAGLDAGADDYLVKPFDPEELIARVRALLRRGRTTQNSTLTFGKLTLNPISFEVAYDQEILPLTPKEYSLLELFLRNPKRVYSCGMILDHVWAHEDTPGEEAIRTHIKGLRHKLKASGAGADVITTVYGIGYRLKPQNTSQSPKAGGQAITSSVEQSSPLKKTNEIWFEIDEIWKNHQTKIIEQLNLVEATIHACENRTLSHQSRETGIRNAHSLAGSLGTFGLPSGSTIARSLELMLISKNQLEHSEIEQLQRWIQELRNLVDQKSGSHQANTVELTSQVKTLLLFDSDRVLARDLRLEAKKIGYELETSSTLKNAITLVENILPKAIIFEPTIEESLDKIVQFLEDLKTLKQMIPVIVYSDQVAADLSFLSESTNVDQYLHKPVEANILLQTIQQTIKKTQVTEATILAIDDDFSILSLLKALLEPWGMMVYTLNDPHQFWETLELVQPDLIILDVEMPTYNGIELCTLLRKNSAWSEVPILFLTVHGNAEIVNEIFRAGADDYVKKPLVGPELVTRILNRLERIRILRRLNFNKGAKLSTNLSVSQTVKINANEPVNQDIITHSSRPGLMPGFDENLFSAAITRILNIADEAILCVDYQQKIIFFNVSAERIFGYSSHEILGHFLDELIPHRYIHAHRQHVKNFGSAHRKAKQMGERQEVYGQRRDGTEFPAEASIARLWEGKKALYTVILKDISERKQREQKKSDFISVVSHEMRTPLTAILGALEMLSRGLSSDNETQETEKLLSIAQNSTDRLVRLVNSALDLERIDLGKVALNLKTHDLATIAEDAVAALQMLAVSQDITIEMRLVSIDVQVDRERIFQTLTNLLSNAIHFSPADKTVLLKLTLESNQAQIEVTDQGPGIPKAQIDHIFEKFHQSEQRKPQPNKGIGLSLATCQSIIKQHDGSIWVESEEGKGSHFFFSLPLSHSPKHHDSKI